MLVPSVRTQSMVNDQAALLARRPSPASPAAQAPAPAPKRDLIQEEAARVEELLRPLDEIALLQLASNSEQVREVAIEGALQEILLRHPGMDQAAIAELRARLKERAS
jgi:hypothetical protein